jgi:hypothetical protein
MGHNQAQIVSLHLQQQEQRSLKLLTLLHNGLH